MRRQLVKWLAIVVGVCAVFVLTLLIAFQIAITRVPEYRVQLQDWLSEKTQLSVEFSELRARLRLYGPELAFTDVTVRSPDHTRVLATARGGSVAFDIWNSIRAGRLTSGRFTLDSPQLALIRTRDGRIQIAGYALLEGPKPFAVENLPVGVFRVRDAVVSFQDEITGRGPWSLSGVSFELDRAPELLELDGDASLPAALGEELEFSARVAGNLELPEQVVSTVTIDGEALDLSGWAEMLPDRWPAPESGLGSMRVTAAFRGQALQSITTKAEFTNLTSSLPAWTLPLPKAAPLIPGKSKSAPSANPASPARLEAETVATDSSTAAAAPEPQAEVAAPEEDVMLSYDRIGIDAHVERQGEGWHAQVRSLDVDAAEPKSSVKAADWHSNGIVVDWTKSAAGAMTVAAKADVIVLDSVTPLLAYLPESPVLAHARALQMRGTVRDISFNMQRDSDEGAPRFEIAALTDSVGFEPINKVPGVTGLSGRVAGNQSAGEFRLDSGPVHFAIPWMFRWPLDTNSMRGVLTWNDDGQALTVATEQLTFDADDGKGEAKVAIRIPRDGSSPHMDIKAQARGLNVAATPKYLPVNNLGPQALKWLDHAFVSGRVPRSDFEFHGPTRSFPFRGGEGLFLVRGAVEGVTFAYQTGWTPATQLSGNVEFRNEGMHASNIVAKIGELEISEASGGFSDFKQGDLKVMASAHGDLNAALRYLQNSPVGEVLGSQFKALRGQGPIQSTVSLLLPLAHIEDRRLSVATKLSDATVRMADLDAPVTDLTGSLIVRQSLPVEADLKGNWLGGPLRVTITPEDRTDTAAQLVAEGRASAARLAHFLPPSVKLSGAMDWRMSTLLTSGRQQGPQVYEIDSQLRGLELDMPYPVGKGASEARPLHVDLEQGERQFIARASLGNLRGLVRLLPARNGWSFDRGGIRADGLAASLPDHPGLRLEGSIDRLRLDDWFALRGTNVTSTSRSAATGKVSDVLHAANLRVGVLQLYGYEWPDVRGIMQATDAGWRVDVTGANIEGQVVIPEDFTGAQPLTANLERFVVTRSEKQRGAADEDDDRRDPRSWPSLRLHIGDMHIENHPIGGLDLVTTRVPNGLRIDSLTIDQDAVQAEAHGDWLIGPQGERSSLVAKITSTDVRTTLRALNYTEFLEAERAEVSAQLSWAGGFDGNLAKRASGTITVAAQSGQLLTLQPGAGRVLGLFSVAALPRRLSLDFSDLTEKGLSFDTIHGDFELREGNAYTNNLLLSGPAAEIGIAGRTGLGSQDFDQTAIVTGNLGASIPVAGALAGGPAVGAALLLFSQVFKEPLKGIARGYYRITGTWDEPVVERVDAAEAKDASPVKPKADG